MFLLLRIRKAQVNWEEPWQSLGNTTIHQEWGGINLVGIKRTSLLVLLIIVANCVILFPAEMAAPKNGDFQIAAKVLEAYYGKNLGQIDKIEWFDFDSSSQANEFFALTDNLETRGPVLDVFSKRGSEWKNILHDEGFSGSALEANIVRLEGKSYLVRGFFNGSGHYLDFAVYAYDGLGLARSVFSQDALYQGGFSVRDGKVYVKGRSQKFELKKGPQGFYLEHLKQNYTFDPAKGRHLLKLRSQSDSLTVTFDGRVIAFIEAQKEKGRYQMAESIRIRKGDRMVLDDNMDEPRGIRIFCTENWSWLEDGPDTTLIAAKKGNTELSVDFEMTKSYTLAFEITD